MDHYDVFLSYSHNDLEAATSLRGQLEKCGLAVFWDKTSIREGDLWLNRLQDAVDACGSFVVLVGRDGVRRWVGAETQVALNRYFGPHEDAKRLPIFPVLLGDTKPETLPAFLRLFQGTSWNAADALPESLHEQIRQRASVPGKIPFEGCPFVGLNAYQPDQAHLFFGRQKETLDAFACFDTRRGAATVRWLEINGNSGCGKSSLMNAGLLPLVDQGWLWPRTGFENWRRIGPMMPGERPVEMLAEHLARSFGAEMGDVHKQLDPRNPEQFDDRALAYWLRSRKRDDVTAFLLAIDQFEELFTFADPTERSRLDHLLTAALQDADCPLFVISTVRADFLERFEDLPRLTNIRNRAGKPWTLPIISADGLREVIDGPARLASLDVSEVKAAMVAEAEDEPGGLALVENALEWLWQQRTNNRLSGQLFFEQGGLAGILSRKADDLLPVQGPQRDRALELLFQLVKVDPEGRRHTRQRIPLAKAIAVAGGGKEGEDVVYRLAGEQVRERGRASGSLRLITVTEEAEEPATGQRRGRWVNLIHETLIRSRKIEGEPQPYWPTLWHYVEKNTGRAIARDRARLLAVEIEGAAGNWEAANRAVTARWGEDRFQEVMREIRRSGVSMDDVVRPGPCRAFFGPIDPREIERLLALGADEDEASGSGRYGDFWHLPLSHRERANLGDRLALLGDRRPGVGLCEDGLPDIAWRWIDGGTTTITMGGEAVQCKVKSFSMARYPVTIDQFSAFVRDCYRDGHWQLPSGFPADYIDAEPPAHEGHHGNYPADSVSWYDAMAFCHWLSARLGGYLGTRVEIWLPTEFHWQLAATGGNPANQYPWGADWDPRQEPWRANTSESGLGRSTSVGLYPHGASRADVLDLAGTVWEWCLNDYDHPEDFGFAEDTFRPRVLRGGSWGGLQPDARCTYRYRRNPGYRNGRVGFRVACLSPIEGH